MVMNTKTLDEQVSFPRADDEWHSFLDGYFEEALAIKRYVNDLPETSATFKLDAVDGIDSYYPNLDDRIALVTGAWKVPDIIGRNAKGQQWVNPNYAHSQHYSDAMVKCGCGIPVVREKFGEKENQPSYHQEHEPNCNKINRTETRLQILQNRRRIIKEAYDLGQTTNSITPRLGYGEGTTIAGKLLSNLGLDCLELAINGRKKLARTFMVLARKHSPEDIAELYEINQRTVSQIISNETKSDASAMFSVRRAQ